MDILIITVIEMSTDYYKQQKASVICSHTDIAFRTCSDDFVK